ncbi:MAG: protein-tyrosine phosphatase family protein [Caldilineaceae bacterium]
MTTTTPFPDAYWVEPGKLLAGEYPGALDEAAARAKVRKYLGAGVTYFLDLTEEGELEPYDWLLAEEAVELGLHAGYERWPVRDLSTAPIGMTRNVLDRLDALMAAGRVVYVHCWGGVGRTGTMVGCWLVRHGQSGEQALATIESLRALTSKGDRPSPETLEQRNRVLTWPVGG